MLSPGGARVPWVTVTPSGFVPQSPPQARRWGSVCNTPENLPVLLDTWCEAGPAVGNRPCGAWEPLCLWLGDSVQGRDQARCLC